MRKPHTWTCWVKTELNMIIMSTFYDFYGCIIYRQRTITGWTAINASWIEGERTRTATRARTWLDKTEQYEWLSIMADETSAHPPWQILLLTWLLVCYKVWIRIKKKRRKAEKQRDNMKTNVENKKEDKEWKLAWRSDWAENNLVWVQMDGYYVGKKLVRELQKDTATWLNGRYNEVADTVAVKIPTNFNEYG